MARQTIKQKKTDEQTARERGREKANDHDHSINQRVTDSAEKKEYLKGKGGEKKSKDTVTEVTQRERKNSSFVT